MAGGSCEVAPSCFPELEARHKSRRLFSTCREVSWGLVAPQISQNSNTGEHRGLQGGALVKTVSILKREQGCRWLTVSHIFRLLRILQKLGGVYKILQATLARWRQTVFGCCDVTTFVHFVVAALADGL